MQSDDAYKKALKEIDKQLERPIPTPTKTFWVLWYKQGDVREDNAAAALVTETKNPGQVDLTIFPPNSMPIHKQGVLYCQHPQVQKNKRDGAVVNNGVWDYPPDKKPLKSHLALHTEQLERRREKLHEDRRIALDAERARAEQVPREHPLDGRPEIPAEDEE